MKKEIETNLEWKKHDKFFDDMNKMLDMGVQLEIKMYNDIIVIYDYYAMVSGIMSKHSGYIRNFEKKDLRMKAIRKSIYSPSFREEITKKNNDRRFLELTTKIFDDLVNVYREIIKNLIDDELLPKVTRTEVEDNDYMRGIGA